MQVKVIVVARKEKGVSWQIHICHSIVVTLYYSFAITFAAVMDFAPSLSSSTGNWFCYIAWFVQLYCYHALSTHTLLVAIMKYVFIVHRENKTAFGKEKVKKLNLPLKS